MKFLLDTCVISEFVKPYPNPVVDNWLDQMEDDALYLSVLTLAEINYGITLLGDSAKARYLHDWLNHNLLGRFSSRLLHINKEVALEWSRQKAMCKKSGHPRPLIDLLLAATAMVNGLTIATRNVSDFNGLNVSIFNPWES